MRLVAYTPQRDSSDALTLIEVLVVICICIVVAALLLPSLSSNERAPGVRCMSNQKQLALALFFYAQDNTNRFPWQVSALEQNSSDQQPPANCLELAKPYFGGNFWILVCPTDKTKTRASKNAILGNQNISYFLNLDAVASNTNATSI